MDNSKAVFLQLVRFGIGTGTVSRFSFQDQIDWTAVKKLAEQHGLNGVVLDGLEVLRTNDHHNLKLPDKLFLTQWIGEVLQGYEFRYEQYCKAISELAGFYNSHGLKMMVLKGYACSLDWPKPHHRPCGDIDIWQFGQQKEADAVLAKEKGVEIDSSLHHHTVFNWDDFMVENHYDFINVHSRRSNAEMEKVFKELGKDDSNYVKVLEEKVYLPSPNLHALFLIKHMVSHFASTSITLRQVLDWGFFVKAHTSEIDWEMLGKLLEKYHMKDFLCCVNAICVEDLGFNATIFHGVQFNPSLKDKVINDILEYVFDKEEPKYLIMRIIYKYRRWKSNSWKRDICYGESNEELFWGGVWVHLLKPASI